MVEYEEKSHTLLQKATESQLVVEGGILNSAIKLLMGATVE